ncbi:MAG: hypothetical protein R6V45_01125 [Oceanipulchritudo sp.]
MRFPDRARVLAALPSAWYGWVGFGILLVIAMVVVGGGLGALLYPLVGTLIGMDLALLSMLRTGFMDGAFYALIWAPGASIVLCIAGAYEKKRPSTGSGGESA